ncbi:hypothetical protein [Fodinibius sp. Rm-B-1B1-1]|uniref:hypothetical protein n=1 Tax=Fodinibius alkaliphilus TaxID=3140241 RepID=UPI00315A0111
MLEKGHGHHTNKNDYLKRVLTHAVNTTPFYSRFSYTDRITDFPVINKNTVLDHFEDFKSRKFKGENLKKISTSGSTGVPLKLYHDKGKQNRQHAENIYFNELGGFEVGDRLYYLRVWNETNALHPVELFLKNIVPVDVSDLSEEQTKDLIGQLSKDHSKKAILVYPSTLKAINQNLDSLGITKVDSDITCIFTMAEALDPQTRKEVEEKFGCQILSRYSNSENGFLGHQVASYRPEYLVNVASYHIEILDFEKDKPVDFGKSGRIVVTDLFNYAMPLIRYDTGDIGVITKVQEPGKEQLLFFQRIEGRKLDFIHSTNGKRLSPHFIDYALRKYDSINQFQLVQTGKTSYTLKLNTFNTTESFCRDIKSALKKYVGDDASISIKFVHEIPLLSSGKRQFVVNELNLN